MSRGSIMTGLLLRPGSFVAEMVKVPRAELAWYRFLATTIDTDMVEHFGPTEEEWRGRWSCWCDEDGKPKNLPINHAATHLARAAGWRLDDFIVGTVVFLGGPGGRSTVPAKLLDLGPSISLDFRINYDNKED